MKHAASFRSHFENAGIRSPCASSPLPVPIEPEGPGKAAAGPGEEQEGEKLVERLGREAGRLKKWVDLSVIATH